MTDKLKLEEVEEIRIGLLALTGNDNAATAKAIKLIRDEKLEYRLFAQLWSGSFNAGDVMTKVDAVYQRVQETKKTLFHNEVAE